MTTKARVESRAAQMTERAEEAAELLKAGG